MFLAVAYLLLFVLLFDPLSYPCRAQTRWIGPKLRFDDSYLDIGKVYEYQKEAGPEYMAFRPHCQLWLGINGLK